MQQLPGRPEGFLLIAPVRGDSGCPSTNPTMGPGIRLLPNLMAQELHFNGFNGRSGVALVVFWREADWLTGSEGKEKIL